MLRRLHTPIDPSGRFCKTTPLHLIVAVTASVLGVLAYASSATYEGAMLVYMGPVIICGYPYLRTKFTHLGPALLVVLMLPLLWAIQNGGVQVRNWEYSSEQTFLLGYLREQGDGPFGWTRWLWMGVDMPAVEYVFYPSMSYFMMCSFALFARCATTPRSTRVVPTLGTRFFAGFGLLSIALLLLPLLQQTHASMDHNWYLIGFGFSMSWLGILASPSFRRLCQQPWFWAWLVAMGLIFQPAWEFFHACLNHNWVYVRGRTLPVLYSYNDVPISIVEPFGYIGVSIMFPALLHTLADRCPRLSIRSGEPGWVHEAFPTNSRGAGEHQ